MNTSVMSDEQLQDLFDVAFGTEIADLNSITEFESKCLRTTGKDEVKMQVTVMEYAGTPTIEDFVEGRIEESDSVTISMEEKGSLKFGFDPLDSYTLNGNYVLTYVSE